jgi:chlorophyllide a reductase subunit Y
MSDFFGGVGSGDAVGICDGVPRARPEFRDQVRRQVIKLAKRRKAEEMI